MFRLVSAGSLFAMAAGVRHTDMDLEEKHEGHHKGLRRGSFDEAACPTTAKLTKYDRNNRFEVPQCLDADSNEVDARCCALHDAAPKSWRNRVCPKGVFPELCIWDPNDDDRTIDQVHDDWKGKFSGNGLEHCQGNLVMVKVDAAQSLYAPVRLLDTHKVNNFKGTYMKLVKIHMKEGQMVAERTNSFPYFRIAVENPAGDREKEFAQGDRLVLSPSGQKVDATYHYVGGIFSSIGSRIHRITGFGWAKPTLQDDVKFEAVEQRFIKPCNDKSWETEDEQDDIDKPPEPSNSSSNDSDDDDWHSNSDGSNSDGSDGSSSDGSNSDGSDGSSSGNSDGSSHEANDTRENYSFTSEDPFSGTPVTWSTDPDKWE